MSAKKNPLDGLPQANPNDEARRRADLVLRQMLSEWKHRVAYQSRSVPALTGQDVLVILTQLVADEARHQLNVDEKYKNR